MPLDIADVCGGVISGGAGVIVGQPLSVVIVRMQTAGSVYNNSTLQCIRTMYRSEGLPVFFRGLIPPLVSIGALHGILFGTYSATRRVFEQSESQRSLHTQVLMSGLVAGAVTSFFTSPVELLKNRAQAPLTPAQMKIELNPYTCARHIIQTRGWRGIFLGFGTTALRDTPSHGLFFLLYEMLLTQWDVREQAPQDSMDLATFAKLNLAGGIAGIASWFTYPLDVIKSRIQTQSLEKPMYNGIIDCAQKIVKAEGAQVLVRGLSATIVQAFPVSAVTIAIYELIVVCFKY